MSAAISTLPNLHAHIARPEAPQHLCHGDVKASRLFTLLLPTLIGLVIGCSINDWHPGAVQVVFGGLAGGVVGLGMVAIADVNKRVREKARILFGFASLALCLFFPTAIEKPHLQPWMPLIGGALLVLSTCYAFKIGPEKQKQAEQEREYSIALEEFEELSNLRQQAEDEVARYRAFDDLAGRSNEEYLSLDFNKLIQQSCPSDLTPRSVIEYLQGGSKSLPQYIIYHESVTTVEAYNADRINVV